MKIEDLLSHLSDVRRCGEGYMARCPAHDDRHQSLSVSPGEEGRVLIKCHAGCSVTAVMSAMGLRLADLFPDRELAPRDSWPEAEYVYPGGQVKKVKVRHADGGKHFYWQHLENGKWRPGRGPSAPLYWRRDPGPEGLLFLVEGEKDVDTLDALGLCALSLPDGAKSNWRPEYAQPMEGKLCVLLPDNDDPGRAYAHDLAERLYDKASALKLVDLRELWPEAPEHADVSDYLASGEKLPLVQALLEKVSGVPDMEKPAPSEGVLAGFPRASDLQEEEARWLVPGWIPEGGVTLIAAEGGLGKTTLWVELLSAFSAGRACLLDPPGYERRPLDVAFCTTEDSLRKRLLKKLRLADGDLRRIRAMDMRSDKSGFLSRFKFGAPEMEQVLRSLRPAVCVFDPIQSFLPPEVNMGSRNAMRHCFNQLSALGEELGITFLLICHTNKRLR
ncbi:MAG: AAA family ATPase [Oscillospiraceae bacterium]|nr:AAA family ATPase [Oscillospiraceae bacterium]